MRKTERSTFRAMCGLQLKDRDRYMDLMLGLIETADHSAMANSVRRYFYALRRKDGPVLVMSRTSMMSCLILFVPEIVGH